MQTIVERLRAFAATFDARLAEYLAAPPDVPDELATAVRYSALAPGKRLRPYLASRCAELAGGTADQALPAAIAVECVHAFSLIHDDLPAMDDDDLRRGQPTCHKKFGEAMAILAGDALVMLAFEGLAKHVPGEAAAAMVHELAVAAGWAGMIGGQTADVQGEGEPPSVELARFIHERKTASLFRAACRLGALSAGAAPGTVAALGDFGQRLGQAFQIADDLLDVTANAEVLGKDVRKDATVGKQSFPRCVGIEDSRAAADEAVEAAIGVLGPFGEAANDLRDLAQYVVSRDY